ncbi:DsbA family oxidoreductase [Gelidibacter pelagius]|uniref:DsbA family oxidoreductase n=1 Tax=Gelidibacter pelagius TaxID=2819985 RepID=A0ABS3SWX0_9FLAO|nr:DsbA family oxidoreductase [Gelidibacter pelagius]MBO3099946.1 DsbA family oxidoreductase [Gelidibacter pelagius]
MTITIWSDIRCPFCYIGKRKLENAISQFKHKDDVSIEWKSFELDPNLRTNPDISTIDYFVNKGANMDQMSQMLANSTAMAKEVGIDFNFKDAVVANSFNAHKLMHAAKNINKQNEAKELLLKAHFTDGKNIDDMKVLVEIGESLGFEAEDIEKQLNDSALDKNVAEDQMQAKEIGVTGVPFFVFNNKHALSGAQPEEVFLEALENAYNE